MVALKGGTLTARPETDKSTGSTGRLVSKLGLRLHGQKLINQQGAVKARWAATLQRGPDCGHSSLLCKGAGLNTMAFQVTERDRQTGRLSTSSSRNRILLERNVISINGSLPLNVHRPQLGGIFRHSAQSCKLPSGQGCKPANVIKFSQLYSGKVCQFSAAVGGGVLKASTGINTIW